MEKIIIGITQGDINGIGYEVIIKSLMDPRITDLCTPVIYGSPKVAAYHRKALDIDNFSLNAINKIEDINYKKPNIINCIDENIRVELGKSSPEAGEAARLALEAGVKDLGDNKIHALITGPINKQNVQSPEFQFSGHTEYLQYIFKSDEVLMLMVSDLLKVGVVAGHIPISQLSKFITEEMIYDKIKIMNQSLIRDFGIRKPRIAVLGLNPHAGDNGLLGTEEIDIIIPAINKANDDKIIAKGPYPADGFFGSGNFKFFDGILAMYHDQGLAPFKTLVPEQGVNFTAGLPVIRTSPAHGTAYDLAGKNEANYESFLNAIYTAVDVYKNRMQFDEINKNPLAVGLPKEVEGTREQPGE